MKWGLFVGLLFSLAGLAGAEVTESRSFVEVSGLATRGNDSGWGRLGGGAAVRSFQMLDPSDPNGWYYGFMTSAFFRVVDGISLADTQIVTWGWRGDLGVLWNQDPRGIVADASVSPVLGARIEGNTILGSTYTGLGLHMGLSVAVMENAELGIAWEPMIPLARWGAPVANNEGYSDFALSWVTKIHSEVKTLPWSRRDGDLKTPSPARLEDRSSDVGR